MAITFPINPQHDQQYTPSGIPVTWQFDSGRNAWRVVRVGPAWMDIVNKPTEFPPTDHEHPIDEVTGLQEILDVKQDISARTQPNGYPSLDQDGRVPMNQLPFGLTGDWDDITDKPATFPPDAHSHPVSEISDSGTTGQQLVRAPTQADARDIIGAIGPDDNARVQVEKNSAIIGVRRSINFKEGSNVTLAVVDDPGNEEVGVTINAAGGGGGGSTLIVSEIKPASPFANDVWLDTATGIQFVYYDDGTTAQWIESLPYLQTMPGAFTKFDFPAAPVNDQLYNPIPGATWKWSTSRGVWFAVSTSSGSYTQAESDAKFVDIVGDVMTGPLGVVHPPTANAHAASKQYVDAVQTSANNKVAKAGDTMTGKLTIDPPDNTDTEGLFIQQNGATTGGPYGSSGLGGYGFAYNTFYIQSDSRNMTPGTGSSTYGAQVYMNTGGSNSQGSKIALGSFLNRTAPDMSVGGYTGDDIALGAFAQASSPNGGTVGVPRGTLFAMNPLVYLGSGATNYQGISGGEVDVGMAAGASASFRVGWSIVGTGAVQGSSTDAALTVGNSTATAGWRTGLLFTNLHGFAPVTATGTLIGTQGAYSVSNGIDFSSYTMTGNFLNGPGGSFTVGGSGNVTVKPATGDAVISLDPTQASKQALISLYQTGVLKWQVGKQIDNSYIVYSAPAGITALDINNTTCNSTFRGDININKAFPFLFLNKTASTGQSSNIYGTVNGSRRWAVTLGDNAPESGSNAGSEFAVYRFSDGDAPIDQPFTIFRQTGNAQFTHNLNVSGPIVSSNTITATGSVFCGNMQLYSGPSSSSCYFSGANAYINYDISSGWWVIQSGATQMLRLQFPAGDAVIPGHGYQPGGGAWLDSSDARIKNELGEYKAGLEEVSKLRPITYTFKGNDTPEAPANTAPKDSAESKEAVAVPYMNSSHYIAAKDQKVFRGLVAQEVESIFPEMVTKREGYIDGEKVTDLRDIDTTPLIFALVNAVKELKARVEQLESA